jgi:hypothetical protein
MNWHRCFSWAHFECCVLDWRNAASTSFHWHSYPTARHRPRTGFDCSRRGRLAKSRQFGLTIRHVNLTFLGVAFVVGQGVNNISQCQQSFIDFDALLGAFSLGASLFHALGTGQIEKRKSARVGHVHSSSLIPQYLLQSYSKDRLRATARQIHERGRCLTVQGSLVQDSQGGIRVVDLSCRETTNDKATIRVFAQVQRLPTLSVVEQVVHVFAVDFEKGGLQNVLNQLRRHICIIVVIITTVFSFVLFQILFLLFALQSLKQFIHKAGNETSLRGKLEF